MLAGPAPRSPSPRKRGEGSKQKAGAYGTTRVETEPPVRIALIELGA